MKKIPIGISNFRELGENEYVFDKTLTKFGKNSPTSKRSESGGMNCL